LTHFAEHTPAYGPIKQSPKQCPQPILNEANHQIVDFLDLSISLPHGQADRARPPAAGHGLQNSGVPEKPCGPAVSTPPKAWHLQPPLGMRRPAQLGPWDCNISQAHGGR